MNFLQKVESFNQKYGNLLFYASLIFVLCSTSWFWPGDMPHIIKACGRYTHYIAVALLGLRILLLSYNNPKYFLCCLTILSVLFIAYIQSGNRSLLFCGMAIAASRGCNYRTILRIFLIAYILVLCITPIFYCLNWTTDIGKHIGTAVGHSWGLSNPNTLGTLILLLAILIILNYKYLSTRHIYAICFLGALIAGAITLSRTSVLLLIAFPFLLSIINHYHINPKCWLILPMAGFVVSLCLAFFYGPSHGATTFESRFSIPYLLYEKHGITWLGQKCTSIVSWHKAFKTGEEALYLNNIYLGALLQYGILAWIVFMGFMSVLYYKIGKCSNSAIKAAALTFFFLGFSQLYPIKLKMDFILLSFFGLEALATSRNSIKRNSPLTKLLPTMAAALYSRTHINRHHKNKNATITKK